MCKTKMHLFVTVIVALSACRFSHANTCSGSITETKSGLTIRSVILSGATVLSSYDAMTIEEELHNGSWRTKQDAADAARNCVRTFYGERGYWKPELVSELVDLEVATDRADIRVRVLNEGKQYLLHEIRWHGNSVFQDEDLRKLIPAMNGVVLRSSEIATGIDRIRGFYANNGYVNASIVPQYELDEQAQAISFLMDVSEGAQYKMGDVNVSGLDDNSRQKFMDQWPLRNGELYREQVVDEYLNSFKRSGRSCVQSSVFQNQTHHQVDWKIEVKSGQKSASCRS